jgi:hypothetical protein
MKQVNDLACGLGSIRFENTITARSRWSVILPITPYDTGPYLAVTGPLLREWVLFGKVRLESHPIAYLEDDSLRAAHAGLCAQEQHKYWRGPSCHHRTCQP